MPHCSDWLTVSDVSGSILDRNLEELRTRFPDIFERCINRLEDSAVEVQALGGHLYRCRSGRTWIHGQDPVAAETRGLVDLAVNAFSNKENDLFCFLGFGLGYVVAEIFERFPKQVGKFEYSRGIVIFERDPALFVAALALFDWRPLLGSGMVFLCVGEDWERQWNNLCCIHRLTSCNKPALLFGYPVRDPSEKDRYVALAGEIQRQWNQAKQTPYDHHRKLRQRSYGPDAEPCKKVWTWYNPAERAIPHILSGLLDAIQERGMTGRMLPIQSDAYYPPWFQFHDLAAFDPDLIVQINLPSSVLFPEKWAHEIPLPRLVWYVDSPINFWHDHPEFYFTDHDHVCVWDETYVPFLQKCGAKAVHVLPYAADIQPPGEPLEQYRTPLSFVGQVKDQSALKSTLTAEERAYLDGIVEEKLSCMKETFEEILRRCPPPSSVGMDRLREKIHVDYYLYVEANARHRIRVLESLSPFGLSLYGSEEWLSVLPEKSPLRTSFCGPLDHRTEFPSLMRSSTINLNIHSIHALASLNMRDYDVPLQDSFLLTDWVTDADRWFEPTTEMVFYHSLEDLRAKVEEFLAYPEKREPIIRAGKERVLADHTYAKRLDQILKIVDTR